MKDNMEKNETNNSNMLTAKKNMNKRWEDEINEWMIEELFTPYQAS